MSGASETRRGYVFAVLGESLLEKTACALLLAHGLAARGRRPLWLQVEGSDGVYPWTFRPPLPFETARICGLAWSAELDARAAEASAAGRDVVLVPPATWRDMTTLLERADVLMLTISPSWLHAELAFCLWVMAMEHIAVVGTARARCRLWLVPAGWPNGPAGVAAVRADVDARMNEGRRRRLPEPCVLPWAVPALSAARFCRLLGREGEEPDRNAAAAARVAQAALALADRPADVFMVPEDLFGEDWEESDEPDEPGPAAWTIEGAISGHPGWPDGARVRLTISAEGAEADDDA